MFSLKERTATFLQASNKSKITFILLSELIAGVLITILTLGLFLKLGENVINKEVITFDSTLVHLIYTFRNPYMTSIMKILTFIGGPTVTIILAVLITLTILRKHKKDALIFSFTLLFGMLLNLLLKDLFHRSRPLFLPLAHETSYSFPSGHAMNAFIFYTCISFIILRKMKNRKLSFMLMFLSVLMILLIGLSRIYLGVHYPSDVLAGYIAGICWFAIVLLFEKTITFIQHLS